MKTSGGLLLAVSIAALLLVGGVLQLLPLRGAPASTLAGPATDRSTGMSARLLWRTQPDQAAAQTADGSFGIKFSVASPKDILLIYAAKTSRKGILQVVAGVPTAQVAQVQQLGRLGEYDIGVIRLTWSDKLGQVISLQVTPAGSSHPWRIAPLKQINSYEGLGRPTYTQFSYLRGEPSAVVVEGGRSGPLTDIKLSVKGQPAPNVAPMFLRIDRDSTVYSITEAEFIAAAAPMPVTTGPLPAPPGVQAPAPLQGRPLPPIPAPSPTPGARKSCQKG